MKSTPSDKTSRFKYVLPTLCLFVVVVLFLHPLPLFALLPHLRALLGAVLPFVAAFPFALRLLSRNPDSTQPDIDTVLFGIGIGHGLLCALTFVLLTMNLVYVSTLGAVAALLLIVFLRQWEAIFQSIRYTQKPSDGFPRSVFVFLLLAGLLYLVSSLLPPTNYDGLEYHLPVPEAWLDHHGWVAFPLNIYAWFPMNVEILYMWGLAFGGVAATTVMNLFYAVGCAAAVWSIGRRICRASTAWLAVVVFLASGLVMRLAIQADIDLGVCFYSILALLAFVRWIEQGNTQPIVLCAVFVGLSLGSKYIALISVWAPMLLVTLFYAPRGKRATGAFWMLVLPILVMGPWLVRNWLMTGNPVFPLLYSWFGGEGWTSAANEFFKAAHSPKSMPLGEHLIALVRSPFDLTILKTTVFSPLILLGIVLIPTRQRKGTSIYVLSLFSLIVFALWFILTQRNDRFLVTIVPTLSILAAVGLNAHTDWLRSPARWPVWILAYASLFTLIVTVSFQNGLRYLCGTETTKEYYARVLPHTRAIHLLNEQSREESIRVMFVGEAQAYGCEFETIVPVVFNPHPWLRHNAHGEVIPISPEEAAKRLRDMGVTHILYNQSELSRLIRGYMPLGWPDGRELARLIPIMRERYCETVFETENGIIRVLRFTGG